VSELEIILNTGGTAFQGACIKGGRKFTDEYTQEAAYCDINPEDFVALGKPWLVKITNEYGDSVVLQAKKNRQATKRRDLHPTRAVGEHRCHHIH
jgi:formylmethanofuran dehydrogenase subunit D